MFRIELPLWIAGGHASVTTVSCCALCSCERCLGVPLQTMSGDALAGGEGLGKVFSDVQSSVLYRKKMKTCVVHVWSSSMYLDRHHATPRLFSVRQRLASNSLYLSSE